jgi:hypothetical protein
MRSANHALPSRTGQASALGSANSSLSTPNFLRIAVTPSTLGVISIKSMATASPGSAPCTMMGPAMGVSG